MVNYRNRCKVRHFRKFSKLDVNKQKCQYQHIQWFLTSYRIGYLSKLVHLEIQNFGKISQVMNEKILISKLLLPAV